MIEFLLRPALIGVALGVLVGLGIELDGEIYIRKSRARREIFFEALERKHNYCCIDGRKDKSIIDFIREVEMERSAAREKDISRAVYRPGATRSGI